MKKLKFLAKIVAAAAFLSIVLTGCPGPASEPTPSTPEKNTNTDNPITGPLTVAETWAGEDDEGEPITYYINSTYTIKDGGNLTIEEGAIVKFGPSGKIQVNNTGALTATGTKFTSYRDTDGRAISISGGVDPAPADWKQILINGGIGTFTSCKFYYGGQSCSTLEIVKASGSCGKAKIDGCEFCYNDGTKAASASVKAALCYSKDSIYSENDTIVKNCVFKNNVWPMSIPFSFTLDDSNQFGLTEEEKNTYNYIHVIDTSIAKEYKWNKQSVPYLYPGTGQLTIKDGGKLTINGSEDSENPALICFAQRGIKIEKGGNLSLTGNIKFTNSPLSSATKFDGIYCESKIQYRDVGIATARSVILTSNAPFIIENDNPTGHYAEDDEFSIHYRREIKSENVYIEELL